MGYRAFEKVIHKIKKADLVSCDFAQFFGNGNLAEEKSVILIIDCYNRKQAHTIRKPAPGQNDDKLINLFNTDADYQYFVQIYQKWKERKERIGGVVKRTA